MVGQPARSASKNGKPAPQQPVLPVDRRRRRAGGSTRCGSTGGSDPNNHDIDTFQARSHDDGATWTNSGSAPRRGIRTAGSSSRGAFIGDYSGIAANDQAVYPVWTDGRDSAIDKTGIGETDIFTAVEILGA